MYDSCAASCDQPIHLINLTSISALAMSLLKKMSLHLYICTQFCQAWHIHLQFNNIVITRYAVGPAIDVVRRNYGQTICTNRAGVWNIRIFSRLAICACLLFVESITASAAPGVYPVDVKVCGNTFVNHRRSR